MTRFAIRAMVPTAIGIIAGTISAPAFAYIGPGAGITMLGALWGVLAALVLALAAVLYWPIRAAIRSWRRRRRASAPATDDPAAHGARLADRDPNP